MFDRAKFWRYTRYTVLTVALLAAGYTLYLDIRVREEFEGRRFALPARIYARPLELHAGLKVQQAAVEQELRDLGYRDALREGESGWFERKADGLEIAVRPFVFCDGPQEAKRLRATFEGGKLSSLHDAQGAELALARLEPLLIGGIYPANNEDRILVRLTQVPQHFVNALVANEDCKFFSHSGYERRAVLPTTLNVFSPGSM